MMQTGKRWILAGLVALAFAGSQAAGRGLQQDGICAGQKVVYDGLGLTGQMGISVAVEGDIAAVGAPTAGLFPGLNPGVAFVFERLGNSWSERARLVPSDGLHGDNAGISVSVSGERIVVGARRHPSGGLSQAGAAYIYERQDGFWVEVAKLTASDKQVNDFFGWSVAIDGDTAVVGARQKGTLGFVAGAAYVFERVEGQWVETQKLLGSAGQAGDTVGASCAIHGDWIVVGGTGIDGLTTNSGGAYVFQRTPGGWQEAALLVPWDDATGMGFGVAVHGERIALGARNDHEIVSGSGAVYAFELEDGIWTQAAKLKAPDPGSNARLGTSVSLTSDGLLAGANNDPDADGVLSSGSAYLFIADDTGYTFSRKFRAANPMVSDFFGRAVALSGDTVLVGVYNDDEGCLPPLPSNCGAGAAWFFEAPTFAAGLCFGSPCPCGNDDPARGCASSVGKGATLAVCGSASVAADDLAVRAEHLPSGTPTLLFQALDPLNGGNGVFAGDGKLCIGNQTLRLGTRWADAAGQVTWGPGLADLGQWQAGETLHLQAWYRDAPASPCGSGFNTTHALEVTFSP